MTTTVHILIQGNKKCAVKVIEADGSESKNFPPREVMPQSWATMSIYGEQRVDVQETGEFL